MTADSTLSPATRTKSNTSAITATSAAPTPSASEFSYPHGHLGHLNEFQEGALLRFKTLLEERGVYIPGPPASHDDPLLLRFLRARRWVPEDAYTQLKTTEDWRTANDINVLYNTIDLEAYEQSRRMYPQWTGRRDKRGIPLYVYEIKNLDSKTVANYLKVGASSTLSDAKMESNPPPGSWRLFPLYENLTRFTQAFCTQLTDREHPDVPITLSTNIVDVSGTGFKQFWNLKDHMQAASILATAHYPETLDRIFILGAPYFFSTVWGWIKRWFDPITVSKIFILNKDEVLKTLTEFIDIKNIPKKYGGELDYEFGKLPTVDPNWEGVVQWENGFSSFPSGPMLWEEVDDGERLACIGLGRKDGKHRRERICTVPKTFPPKALPETNGVATEAEGTQTSEAATQNDATQTDDALMNGDALEKLKLGEDGKADAQVPPAVPTTVV